MSSTDYWAVTDCKVSSNKEKVSFKWRILNLQERVKNGIYEHEVMSPEFHDMYLRVEFNKKKRDTSVHCFRIGLLYLGEHDHQQSHAGTLSISGYSADDNETTTLQGKIGDVETGQYSSPGRCFLDYFNSSSGGDWFLFGNDPVTLEFILKIEICVNNQETSFGAKVYPEPLLKRVYGDPKYSDIVVSSGDSEFKCHKVIFAAMSPVFDKMFEVNMKEATSGVVEMEDLSSSGLKALVDFMYTGCFDISPESIAEKYDVSGMMEKCETWMGNNLRKETSVDFLMIADQFNLKQTKQMAMKKITANKRVWNKDIDFQNQMKKCSQDILFQIFNM